MDYKIQKVSKIHLNRLIEDSNFYYPYYKRKILQLLAIKNKILMIFHFD